MELNVEVTVTPPQCDWRYDDGKPNKTDAEIEALPRCQNKAELGDYYCIDHQYELECEE